MANSHRKCKHCGQYVRVDVQAVRAGVVVTPKGAFCDAAHAFQWAHDNGQRASAKAADAKRKAYKAETKSMRAKLNQDSHKWQTAETQRAFNELVRLLDADRPCIVHGMHLCGHESGWSAGHYLTVASHPHLRFDLRNCYKQCLRSNKGDAKYLANNASIRTQFEYGIATMHGGDLLAWLKGHHPAKHYTCAELADMRADFRAEISRIKKGRPPSQDWRQLQQESAAA
jgi:hypothetical protein